MAITYSKDIPDFDRKVKDITNITEIQEGITEIQEDIAEIQGDVEEVQGDVSTLASAVTTLDGEVEALKPKVVATFTKDGTTTYADALASMFNANINERSLLIIDSGTNKNYHNIYRLTSTLAWFTSCVFSGGHGFINTLQVQPTGSVYQAIDFNVNAGTMSAVNESASVAESMQIINL